MSAEKERRYQELVYKNRFVNPIDQGVGRRTGWVLTKDVRKDSEGFDVFDDYWSDSGDDSADDLSLHDNKQNNERRYKLSSPVKNMPSFTLSSRGGSTDVEPLSEVASKTLLSNAVAITEPKPQNEENATGVAVATPPREEGGIQESDITGSIIKGGTSFQAPHSALQDFKTKTRLTFDEDGGDTPRRRSTRRKSSKDKSQTGGSEESKAPDGTVKASQSSMESEEHTMATASLSAEQEEPEQRSSLTSQEDTLSKMEKETASVTEKTMSSLVEKTGDKEQEDRMTDLDSSKKSSDRERTTDSAATEKKPTKQSTNRKRSTLLEQTATDSPMAAVAKPTRRRRKNMTHVEEDSCLSGEEGMFISLQKSFISRHDGTKETMSDMIKNVLNDQSFQDADDEEAVDIVENDQTYKSTRAAKVKTGDTSRRAKGRSLTQDEPLSKSKRRRGKPKKNEQQEISNKDFIDLDDEKVMASPARDTTEPAKPAKQVRGRHPSRKASSEEGEVDAEKSRKSQRSKRSWKSTTAARSKPTSAGSSSSGGISEEHDEARLDVDGKKENQSTKKAEQHSTVAEASDEVGSTGTDEDNGRRKGRKSRKTASTGKGGEDSSTAGGDTDVDVVEDTGNRKTRRTRVKSVTSKESQPIQEADTKMVHQNSSATIHMEVNHDGTSSDVVPQEQVPSGKKPSSRKSLGKKRVSVHFSNAEAVPSEIPASVDDVEDVEDVESALIPGGMSPTSLHEIEDDYSLPRKKFKGTPGPKFTQSRTSPNRSQDSAVKADEQSRKSSVDDSLDVIVAAKKLGKRGKGKRKLYSGDIPSSSLTEPSLNSNPPSATITNGDPSPASNSEGLFTAPRTSLSPGGDVAVDKDTARGKGRGRGRVRGKTRERGGTRKMETNKDSPEKTQDHPQPDTDIVLDFLTNYEKGKSSESAESSDDHTMSPMESSEQGSGQASLSAVTTKVMSTTVYPEPTPRSILKGPTVNRVNNRKKNLTLQFFEVPKTKAIIMPPDHTEDGQRRTKRNRVRPLEFWRNERPVYKRRVSGGFALAGVESPANSSPEPRIQQRGRGKKKIPQTPVNISMHASPPPGGKVAEHPAMTVVNPDTQEEVVVDTLKTAKMYKFVGPSGKEATAEDPITLCKCITQKAFSSGILTIRPLSEKGMQLVRNDTMVFYITRGKVAVTIHHTTSIMQNGDMFFVPQGNMYNVKNLRRDEAKLVFFQHKGR